MKNINRKEDNLHKDMSAYSIQRHIMCKCGEIGEYVIVPGDPFRTDIIAKYFEDAKLIAHNREHKTYTGTYKGIIVSVTSTGMGCPSAAIAAEELYRCGAKVLIRLGGGYLLRSNMKEGDIAVTLGSMKEEGTTRNFIPDNYPAIADIDLVIALVRSAECHLIGTGQNVHTGVTVTTDGFYSETDEYLDSLRKSNVMNIEMESAAIISVCQKNNIRGACICACGVDSISEDSRLVRNITTERQIKITLDAIYDFDCARKEGKLINNF